MSTTVLHTPRICSVEALSDYRLHIYFEDGTNGVVELENRLFGPMFMPLRDIEKFKEVTVDEFGAPCWPNGADLAPDALYDMLRKES